MTPSRLMALDADGVLLDYNLAYAAAWERAFGTRPQLCKPQAYWAKDRWGVATLEGEALNRFRASFDEAYWSSIPAISGAVQACEALVAAGYELVCVSAVKPEFGKARLGNLLALGFPIAQVYATSNEVTGRSPKAQVLEKLQPVAFVDDYLPYFRGVPQCVHTALVRREQEGGPNTGPDLKAIDSTHHNLADFADWWLKR